jgi:hypothetical protein
VLFDSFVWSAEVPLALPLWFFMFLFLFRKSKPKNKSGEAKHHRTPNDRRKTLANN